MQAVWGPNGALSLLYVAVYSAMVLKKTCAININGGSRANPPPSRNCIQDRDTLIEQSITLIKQSQCS